MSCQLDNTQTRKVKLKQNIRKSSGSLIPLIRWLLSYSKIDAIADLITGITIGLIIIPQSVAYVAIVGLSAKIGLLSSVVGGIIYTFLGTVKEISMGPTAMMALLTTQYTSDMSVDHIGTLCFGCAIVGCVLSILRLGLVVEFISIPVSSAFGSSVALTILASELKNLMGLNYKANKFIESLEQFGFHVTESQSGDVSLGVICIMILILLDKLKYLPISRSWKHRNAIKKTFWLIAMSKNAICLILACLLTWYFEKYYGTVPYALSDPVTPGIPEFRPPWMDVKISNNVTITFQDKVRTLYLGMIITPIVALLVHVTIAKFFDSDSAIGISHELFSTSLCNFLCSFFNSSPVAGAFSRSAVSSVCQVRTPISSIYASIMTFLALTLLTPYFRLIPKASLSAVIVTAVFSVIDYKILISLWKYSKKDLSVLLFTLVCGLWLGIEIGLITGVIINLLFLVYLWARPSIGIDKCKCEHGEYAVVTPDLGLFYPAVSYLETKMYKTLRKEPYKNLPIAVNCIFFKGLDYTAVKGLIRIIHGYQKQKRKILLFNASQKIYYICAELDNSAAAYFCDSEEQCKHLLFSDHLELDTVKANSIIKRNTNKEMNGNCSKVLVETPPTEDVPAMSIIKKQNRPNSL